jgi:hypothetical protein
MCASVAGGDETVPDVRDANGAKIRSAATSRAITVIAIALFRYRRR